MQLFGLVLASIILFSILGIQESFAGEPALNMRLIDEFGNSVHTAYVNQETYISNDIKNKQDKVQPFTLIIQIKDETNTVVHLSWLTNSLSVGEISSHTLSWIPIESGTYTATAFVWESIDSPISLERALTMTIDVLSLQSSDNLESMITSEVDVSKTIQENAKFQNNLITNTESKTPEITFVLNREIIYGDEGLGGIVTSTSDESLYWYMVDSDGKAVMPYYQNLSRSGDMSKWSSKELDMSSYGRDSFGTTTNIFAPGEYAIVLFNENIEIKKNFTIMDSKCCRPLTVYASHGAHLPGDEFQIHVKATPQTALTFNLIDPNGKISKTKQITTNQKGEIKWQSLTLSRIAIPGIWTLEVTDGKIFDAIPVIVIPTPDELIKKSATAEEIMVSYEAKLANKKSGYDILLASSLEPFVDDGRERQIAVLHRGGPPQFYYQNIMDSYKAGFDVDEKGIVTYVTTPHEKYSLNPEKGLYPEDWLPDNILDGQKLLYVRNGYSTEEVNGITYESYWAAYSFVPSYFELDEEVTQYDLHYKNTFYIGVGYNELQDEIEDILENAKDIRTEKPGKYGKGYHTITRNGEMVILFEGGDRYNHDKTSIYWVSADNFHISLYSYYYTLDELIPIFESIMK